MKANGLPRDEDVLANDEERLDNLLPGDALEIWADGTFSVSTVFKCYESLDTGAIEWRWMFLDDGSMIEVSPDGFFRYREHRILNQGTVTYEELVAQDGALVRFEERVREGTSGRRPVHVTIDDKQYRITCTGTVRADRLGAVPEPLPWQHFNTDSNENVYFGMVDIEDEDNVILGLWTAHVCLSFGKAFERSDVTSVYRNRGK